MKPSQASIYREIERLLEFTIPMAERFPKSLPYRELGGRLILDLKEAMDFVVLAFQAESRLERLECINAVVMRMTSVKTTLRILSRVRRDTVSRGQYAQVLDMLNSIADQAGKWLRKTKSLIAEETVSKVSVSEKTIREPKQLTIFGEEEMSR